MSYYWDDLAIGQEFVSAGRTVTEADVVNFAGITGDYHPLHTDEEFARKNSIFKTRIAHGLLGLCFAMGSLQHVDIFGTTAMAFYGINNYQYRGPIMIGDTIRGRLTVADKKESRKSDRGTVTLKMCVLNQADQEVQVGEYTILVARRT